MQDFDDPHMATAHVVYYLCRNGKVEPPHMIDVPYRPPGLRLRDVKSRLTALRGCRMPVMYSWSFKRIYKNANIWQDVSDDDYVFPVSGGEYVLKGSEIVDNPQNEVPKKEALQWKYRGAETWLTSVDCPKPNNSHLFSAHRKSYEQPQVGGIVSKSAPFKRMLLPASGSSDEKETNIENVRHSTGNIHEAGIQPLNDVKLYTIKTPAVADHGCDAATQTEELRRRKMAQAPVTDTYLGEPSKPRQAEELALVESTSSSQSSGLKKQSRLKKVFSQEKDSAELNRLKTKNGSSSWMFMHVLSYCGGLDTKAQAGNPAVQVPHTAKEVSSDESRTDGENFSLSDTQQSSSRISSTADSFNSSDTSDEGQQAHKISAFVDVKEMLRPVSPTRGAKGFSFLGRQYGRLSKSGTYTPRNVKYDASRRLHDNGPVKFELSCYSAE